MESAGVCNTPQPIEADAEARTPREASTARTGEESLRIPSSRVRWTGLLAVGLAALSVRVEALPEDPPPLTAYRGRVIAKTMHFSGAPWLVRDSRDREEDCAALLRALDVKPGQTVCDFGCGNGFYTLRLARLVGQTGRVLAVDIQPEMLDLLVTWAKRDGLQSRIEPILGSPSDPKLPSESLDLALMVDVYHELSYPEQILAAVRRSLKPSGFLVLVEFRTEDKAVPIKPEHKMSKEQIRAELIPNGFREVREFDGLPWQHVIFFERAGAERHPARRPSDARCTRPIRRLPASARN